MKLYRSRDLPGRWVGEDQDGALVHWPAEPGGWARRTPYTGPKRGLEQAEPILARGSGWPGGGRGRAPRSAAGEVSTERVTLRATKAEIEAWEQRAAAEDRPVSAWGRDTLNAEVARPRNKRIE